ncbi:hypothetical protein Taro_035690 [Colocasia esculenta]|uniref:Lipid desaturase domain-containing protein n=1 Tax=Colocasia esculenta TaxID=4460 RepID=A0A843WJD7_COLES|nr:hypothetical protein [Colocasia esculenta]
MYAITTRWHLLKHPHSLRARRRLHAALQAPTVTPTATIITVTPGVNPNSNLSMAASANPKLAAGDQGLHSTWSHRAWVAAGCASLLVSLAKSISAACDSGLLLEPFLAAAAGYVLADLGTGVYHWGIDNYGGPSTPVFGAQIDAFQGHHRWPWIITRREFANNLHALGRVMALAMLPFDLATDDAVVHAFAAVFGGCIMFSQLFHAWAHGTKSRLPPLVVALQDLGLLVSRGEHAAHHRPPYNGNYCIVSGVWNEFLDKHRVFEAMEMVIFFRLGVRPRSWSEPESEWMEHAGDDGNRTSHGMQEI